MALAMGLLRIAFGSWFAFWGLAPLVGIETPPTTQPDALALLEANRATFSMDLAQASFVAGGLATMVGRTAPLGLAILAPTVAWGIAWFAAWSVLVWWHRDAYRPLIAYRRTKRAGN